MTDWLMKGEYLKNCNCVASCTCDTIGFPTPGPGCEGLFGMRISEGFFGDIRLDGIKWVAAVKWPGALHEGNGQMQAFIDESADAKQREALFEIFSGKHGNPLMEILSQIITTVHEPQFAPIHWEFDQKKRTAKVSVDGTVATESVPLTVPATGDEQRVVVRMPDGFEYKEMEVAVSKTLTSSGAIKLDHKNSHSSLAHITQTHEGLVA